MPIVLIRSFRSNDTAEIKEDSDLGSDFSFASWRRVLPIVKNVSIFVDSLCDVSLSHLELPFYHAISGSKYWFIGTNSHFVYPNVKNKWYK